MKTKNFRSSIFENGQIQKVKGRENEKRGKHVSTNPAPPYRSEVITSASGCDICHKLTNGRPKRADRMVNTSITYEVCNY